MAGTDQTVMVGTATLAVVGMVVGPAAAVAVIAIAQPHMIGPDKNPGILVSV